MRNVCVIDCKYKYKHIYIYHHTYDLYIHIYIHVCVCQCMCLGILQYIMGLLPCQNSFQAQNTARSFSSIALSMALDLNSKSPAAGGSQ